MSKDKIPIIFGCIVLGFLIGVGVTNTINHQSTSPKLIFDKTEIINFTKVPVSLTQVSNQINQTSIISSTENHPTFTVLNLANGVTINQTDSSIKAGQAVRFSYVVMQPVCAYQVFANGTQYNGTIDDLITSSKYTFVKTPDKDCDTKVNIMRIVNWSLIH